MTCLRKRTAWRKIQEGGFEFERWNVRVVLISSALMRSPGNATLDFTVKLLVLLSVVAAAEEW